MSRKNPETEVNNSMSAESPENPQSANLSKPVSHVLVSSDGGAGKSTAARVLCACYDTKGIAYKLVDADPKLDVCNSYAPELYRKWSGSEDSLDAGNEDNDFLRTQIQLYDTKVTVGGEDLGDRLLMLVCANNTIINLPGNSLQALYSWLDTNYLATRELPFELVFWWVSSGRQADQSTFVEFVNRYPKFKHCILFNEYHVNNWAKFQAIPSVADSIERGVAKSARLLPQRNRSNVEVIEGGKSYKQLVESMHPFMGETLSQWLAQNWKNLEETGLLI
jgi:hypothetical protein